MSFILDALKKSETERQQQGGAEFSTVPVSAERPGAPKWLWIVGALLALNIVVLAVILLRPGSAPGQQGTTSESSAVGSSVQDRFAVEPATDRAMQAQPSSAELTFEQQIAVANENRNSQSPAPAPEAATSTAVPTVESATRAVSASYIRSFDEARIQGLIQMVDLHLDIHVFGDAPADRFVFINMVKHTEGSKLAEGPTVTEITSDGVVLELQGTTFLLPRD
jgi:general secretion pathway protein B